MFWEKSENQFVRPKRRSSDDQFDLKLRLLNANEIVEKKQDF